MKENANNKRRAQNSDIKEGDTVLLRQGKQNKVPTTFTIMNVNQSNVKDDDDYDYDTIAHQNNGNDVESNIIGRYLHRLRNQVQ